MRSATKRATHGGVFMSAAVASTLSDVVLTTIAQVYAPQRHAAKLLARHARASHRTAEKWITGRAVPTGENLINLMAECDALSNEVQRLVAERKRKISA